MAKLALVTGASSGLGVDFAKLFAKDKVDLFLVARRQELLESLAAELRREHGVTVYVMAADLARADSPRKILERARELGLEVDYLVNNAGVGDTGRFWELKGENQTGMVQLNIASLVELTHLFLPGMIARKSGRILNLGSCAGFQPGPNMAVYYASKAFVNSFTEALSWELRGTGVTATASAPGATSTPFGHASGNGGTLLFKVGTTKPDFVAQHAYRSMMKGRAITIPGVQNKFLAFLTRLSPRYVARAVAGWMNS